jgi:ATP-dependent exoDNAse (exonuclease V) beta subunit
MARYRYRLRLPQIEGIHERETGDDAPNDWALDPAEFGSLIHKALEVWGQARIDGEPIATGVALQTALVEYDGATEAECMRARALLARAEEALAALTFVAAEMPFDYEIDGVALHGIIDLVARDAEGTMHVVDYKTGTLLGDDHYALQLDLYARATRARYPQETVRARILRLSETEAQWRDAPPLAADELERLLRESDGFTSDEARPGPQCASCSYNGSPCHAASVLPAFTSS